MMSRSETCQAITDLQDELARYKIDSRHVSKRAKASREAHLVNAAGVDVDRLSEATTESLELFLVHLEGVRPRVEAKDALDDALLASFVLTDDEIEKQYKKFKKGRAR